ncbi:MAG: hypothetical protein IPH94_19180 [Saprospiraceae bacterium]|nr:hypothetical protein [Saprospiraceae bacterium]
MKKYHWVCTAIDQIVQWQTSVPQSRGAVGGGRMADILQDMNSIPEAAMNISLAGKNRFSMAMRLMNFPSAIHQLQRQLGITITHPACHAVYLNDRKTSFQTVLAAPTICQSLSQDHWRSQC